MSATQAAAALSQLPECARAAASQGIEQSGCGFDVVCICTNPGFLTLLQNTLSLSCSPDDQDAALGAAKELCTAAVPSLNDSRETEVLASIIFITVLATIALVLRLISRKISAAKFGMDDLLMIVALVFTYGLNTTTFIGLHFGYAHHLVTLNLNDITSFAKCDFATQMLFALSITSTKLSLLFFYHRIFPVRKFTILSIMTGVIMIGWCIALILAVIFSCKPVSFFWNKSIPGGTCINENTLSYGVTAANIVTDIAVLLLPIPWLWNLQMKTGRKLAITGIFLLGSFVCIAGIVRIPLLAEVKEYDVTWTIVPAGIWINVECNIGIVSACLPVMRPLLNHVPKSFTSRFTSSFSKPFSFRSSKRSSSHPSGGVSSNRSRGFAPHNTLASNTRASHESYWPKDPRAGESRISETQLETYRSTAEGYNYGPGSEATAWQKPRRAGRGSGNRTIWVDDAGRGKTLYDDTLPEAAVGDEEKAEAGGWVESKEDIPLGRIPASRGPAGYERIDR